MSGVTNFFNATRSSLSISAAARSKEYVCGRSLVGITVSIPAGARMSVSCERCVLSSRGLCDRPIACPEEYEMRCV